MAIGAIDHSEANQVIANLWHRVDSYQNRVLIQGSGNC